VADDRRKFPELQTGEVVVRGGFHTGSTRSLPTARIVTVRQVPQTTHMQAGEQMKRRRLGGSGITVSEICMGTMTFGSQCDETLSFRIMDRARDAGIDFFDAAEMYPVPPTAETCGITEEILGRWMKTVPRESVIIATKITGPAHGWFVPPVRHGHSALDRVQIVRAVEASLRRLQTDYIDLYQTHWPDHGMRYEDVLEPLTKLVQQGKIRALGCSNETCWGVMKSLAAAEKFGLCRYDSVQNNFSLINRRCESELAQVCRRENISLLPFSPLGGGVLTGKYQDAEPAGARFTEYRRLGERQRRLADRFLNDRTRETVRRLKTIADDLGVTLTALSLAWSRQHDFVASTIVGATSVEQLEESLASAELILDAATLKRIDEIDEAIPCPMKEDGLRRL
jgi:aryl-alcohol dehydrogenase-like predicted oxidoreductase